MRTPQDQWEPNRGESSGNPGQPNCGLCHDRGEGAAATVKWLGYLPHPAEVPGTTQDVAAGTPETEDACVSAVRPADGAVSPR